MDYDTPPKFDEWDEYPICIVGECPQAVRSFNMCNKHYTRYRTLAHKFSVDDFVSLGGPSYREWLERAANEEKHCSTCTCHPVVSDEEDPETILSRAANGEA